MDPVLPYLACLVLALTMYAAIRPASLSFQVGAIVATVERRVGSWASLRALLSSLDGDAATPF